MLKYRPFRWRYMIIAVWTLVALAFMLPIKLEFWYARPTLFGPKEGTKPNKVSPDTFRNVVAYSIGNAQKSTEIWDVYTRPPLFQNRLIKVKCGNNSNEKATSFFGVVKSDMTDWTFQQKSSCPENIIGNKFHRKQRRKLSIQCTDKKVQTWYTETSNSSNIDSMDFGDPCLNRYIQECCGGGGRVPNVVHYVWYSRGELSFVPFLSLLSVIRFVNPCVIVFHGYAPYGKYWDAFTSLWPEVIILKREQPKVIFGQKIKHKEHSSDVMRIEALIQYGGIYMDTDTLLVKPIDALYQYPCVMSNQSSGLLGSAFVMSEKNGSFVQQWLDGYRYHYVPEKYTYNAMVYPNTLRKKPSNRDKIHIEYATLSRPIDMISGTLFWNSHVTYNWSYIYGVHTYIRIYKKPLNETTIRSMNTSFGSIARHVYYGNKELCL